MTAVSGAERLHGPQALYREWEESQWSPWAIDLATDRDQWATMEDRTLIGFVLGSLMVAEERITTKFAGLLAAATSEEAAAFLATQQVDEARHMQFYARFQDEVVAEPAAIAAHVERARAQVSPAFQTIFDDKLVAAHERLLANSDDRAAKVAFVTIYHLILEATLGLTTFEFSTRFMAREGLLPGFVAGYTKIHNDEHRHIGYGVWFLREAVSEDDGMGDIVRASLRELLPAVAQMREFRAELGVVPAWYLEQAKRELGRSRACLYRWAKDGVPAGERPGFQLQREHKVAVFDERGVGAAWHALRSEGADVPSRTTWYVAAGRDLSELERRYIQGGLPGARSAQLRLERREGRRGDALIADHKLVDLLVCLPGAAKPVRPWITSFMEPSTRAIAGLAVSVRPHRGVVLAALGEAIRERLELTPAHGKPWIIRFDNGLEFLAGAIRSAAMDLGFHPVPLRARSPWLNGKIERWHQTMTREVVRRLPYWTDGPKRVDGTLDLPADVEPLAIEVFIELLLEWVAAYNFERAHSALDGRTPALAWEQDTTPLRPASEQDLRRYLLECPGTRVVEARGVKFQRRWYTSEALQQHLGRRLEVRRMPHDARWLELYVDGQWLCRAVRHDEASDAQRQRVLDARAQAARDAAGIARRAKNRARVRWSTMTAAHPPQATNSVSTDEVREVEDPGAKVLEALGLAHRRGQKRK